jgi:putative ABC transport system substrate-binding protein
MGMRRREFITLLGGAAAWPLAARGQQGERVKRLGILLGGPNVGDFQVSDKQLVEGLAQLGWTEGRNLRVDDRLTGSNDPAIIRPHAESLVRAAPDVIYAAPATAVQVLQRLTSTIPIVFVQNGDPVQAGTVQSLARPGGNITGFVSFEPSMNTKHLQLLKDIAPQMTRVAVLQTEASRTAREGSDFAEIERVARSLAITPASLLVRDDPDDIARAIVGFGQDPNGGLILPPDGVTLRHRGVIAPLAIKYRLPSVGTNRLFVEAGGLMYYHAAPLDYHRLAAYIDRVLRGTNPGELPVQTPTAFNLVINLRTATALGLTIPSSLFALADEVIE